MATPISDSAIIELLSFPTGIIQQEIPPETCHHAGHFQGSDVNCITCFYTPECEWLIRHDQPSNLNTFSRAQLVAALNFAADYIHAKMALARHAPRDCPCESCAWWRKARETLADM